MCVCVCVCVCVSDNFILNTLCFSHSLLQLGYEVPSKQSILGKSLSQANCDQTPDSAPIIEEQPMTVDPPSAGEDIVASDESLSGRDQHLLQARALVEQISLALSELREAVEKVMKAHCLQYFKSTV